MVVFSLKSSNENLSWIIQKNPQNPICIKPLKKGVVYGFYPVGEESQSRFVIFFEDGSGHEVSYKQHFKQQFEYLNNSKYMSSNCIMDCINELLRSAFKTKHELDHDNHHNKIEIEMIKILPKSLNSVNKLQKHFSQFTTQIASVGFNLFKFTVETKGSIHQLLNYIIVVLAIISSQNIKHSYLEDSFCEKLIDCVNVIQAPYFVRYIIGNKLLSFSQWKNLKNKLQNDEPDMTLFWGTTSMQRQHLISSILKFDKCLIDVGCGNGDYLNLANKMKDHTYFALDIDQNCLDKVNKFILRKQIKNIDVCSSLESLFDIDHEVDIIFTEVIEHMTPHEAGDLLALLFKKFKIASLIMTTPNKDFNQHYLLEPHQSRHDDHKWEPTKNELQMWLKDTIETHVLGNIIDKYTTSYLNIGDQIKGIGFSQGFSFILKQ